MAHTELLGPPVHRIIIRPKMKQLDEFYSSKLKTTFERHG